ncbi:MAG: YtxH domain-containing protein, partial [Peptostreptococcaceae bacterium]
MSNKKGKFLLIGVFLGFIAGLFLAPKKGSELRREAKEKFEEVKENPKDVLQETFDGVKQKISTIIDENTI